jgi:methylmalonyl-CoA mutase N-terminal domain/subunit
MDEALALPTEKAARIALRTQQVIAQETGVAHVADPLGGSWYVESLTDRVEAETEEIFAHLDELGGGSILDGVIAGIEEGWFQGEIADAAYRFERQLNTGRRITVGVNRYTEGNDDDQMDLLQISAEDEKRQLDRLAEVKRARNLDAVEAALDDVRSVAADPNLNVMPVLLDAVRTYATVGEVMDALATPFGRWTETPVL